MCLDEGLSTGCAENTTTHENQPLIVIVLAT